MLSFITASQSCFVGRDLQDRVVPLQSPVQPGFVLAPPVILHFSVSQQDRVLGELRGVRGGDS